jgi:hypothetical protein
MASPGRVFTQPGLHSSAKGLVSRILFYAVIPLGAALPLALISDLPGGFGDSSSRLAASGRCAAGAWLSAPASLPIWSCSVWGLPCHSHYWLRGALLPHLFTLTRRGERYVFCGTGRPWAFTPTSRTLSGTLPCGVRTFLSRKPLSAVADRDFRQRPPGPPASIQCIAKSALKTPIAPIDPLTSALETPVFTKHVSHTRFPAHFTASPATCGWCESLKQSGSHRP